MSLLLALMIGSASAEDGGNDGGSSSSVLLIVLVAVLLLLVAQSVGYLLCLRGHFLGRFRRPLLDQYVYISSLFCRRIMLKLACA